MFCEFVKAFPRENINNGYNNNPPKADTAIPKVSGSIPSANPSVETMINVAPPYPANTPYLGINSTLFEVLKATKPKIPIVIPHPDVTPPTAFPTSFAFKNASALL